MQDKQCQPLETNGNKKNKIVFEKRDENGRQMRYTYVSVSAEGFR